VIEVTFRDPLMVAVLTSVKEAIMANKEALTELKDRLGVALEQFGTGIDGVRSDLTALKDKVAELEQAVQNGEDLTEVVASIREQVESAEGKAAALGELDAETPTPGAAPGKKAPASSTRGKPTPRKK
jgi:hypothetical protein